MNDARIKMVAGGAEGNILFFFIPGVTLPRAVQGAHLSRQLNLAEQGIGAPQIQI